MSIVAGQTIRADDFVDTSAGAGDSGKAPKLNGSGVLDVTIAKNGFKPNAGETINGATLPVPVYQNKTDNEVYACDGNDTAKLKFLGFAITNSTDGNSITVKTNGIVSGFSGLDEGEKYYVSDTVGTISTTAGTYHVLVGIAISTTELLIMKGSRSITGTFSASGSTGNTGTINCGFRPKTVILHGRYGEGSPTTATLDLSWTDGVTKSVTMFVSSGSATNEENSHRLYSYTSTARFMTLSITNVTDTSFRIDWTNAGSTGNTNTGVYVYTAYGDF